jgi:tetratricopeptide (TPR) repeat protein
MVRRFNGRLPWAVASAAFLAIAIAIALAPPAAAQSTGMVKGVVRDTQGQPVDGAKVVIEMSEGTSRKFETKSNKKGEFIQIGLPSGAYKVTAEKDKLASNTADVRVRVGSTAETNLVLGAAGAAAASKEAAELKATLEAGIAASNAGNDDEAIAKFTHATTLKPDCADCYYNIGFLHSKKKEYDKAEAAYKKAIEVKADYSDAYNGLANIYNAQRKFDEAAAASTKAAELAGSRAGALAGGNADALFNQGVILWNAGKIAEAKKQFEGVIAANPNHAEAHYQLGMALVNEGNLPGAATEFETYLKLAPSGPNAAQAKALVEQLKK